MKIEKDFAAELPGISLGITISEASQATQIFGVKMDSDRRIKAFYGLGLLMLLVIFLALLFANPNKVLPVASTAAEISNKGPAAKP